MANFDFLPHDVEMFQDGNINITGFQIVDRETRQYTLLNREIEQFRVDDRSEGYVDMEVNLIFWRKK